MNNSASLIYLAPTQTYISNDIKYYNIKYYKNIKYIYIHTNTLEVLLHLILYNKIFYFTIFIFIN